MIGKRERQLLRILGPTDFGIKVRGAHGVKNLPVYRTGHNSELLQAFAVEQRFEFAPMRAEVCDALPGPFAFHENLRDAQYIFVQRIQQADDGAGLKRRIA